MDLSFSFSFNTVALFLSFVFLFLAKWKKSKAANKLQNLPPGPKKWPVIGNMHLVSSFPHRSFSDLAKKYGPLMHLKLGETSTIVVSSAEIAKEVLKTQDPNFAARTGTLALEIVLYKNKNMLFRPHDDYWKQMRRICISELLSNKQVRSYGSIRYDEVLNLVKSIKLSAGKPINLTEKVTSTLTSTMCRAAFGKVCKDKDTLIKIMREALVLGGGFDIADMFPSSKILKILSWNKQKVLAMHRKLDEILEGIIVEHKQNLARMANVKGELDQSGESTRRGNGEFGNEDLVDVFLRVKKSDELEFPIENDSIKAVITEMFSAGTESSSGTISWAMVELVGNPRIMAKARAEVREMFEGQKIIDTQNLKYLKLIVKETLRLHSLPLIPRACAEDCEINGYFIPAKSTVFINTWEMARDPKYWDNPETFEPERFENNSIDLNGNHFEFLPFGAGRRICPGITFGLTSVELLFAQLLYNFDWKLPEGIKPDDLDMTEKTGLTPSRKEDLYLVATPYDPSKHPAMGMPSLINIDSCQVSMDEDQDCKCIDDHTVSKLGDLQSRTILPLEEEHDITLTLTTLPVE